MKRALTALALTPLVLLFAFVTIQPLKVLPRIAPAPGYALEDQTGQPLTSEMVRGDYVIYTFAPVNCDGSDCPPTIPLLGEIQRQMAARSDVPPFRIVVVAVDERSSVAERAAAAERWADGSDSLTVISGEPARVKMLVGDGFRTYFGTRDDGSLQVDARMMIVDRVGLLRAEYGPRLPSIEKVMSDLALLGSEERNSEGAGHLVYEAAHLFQCYAR